MAVDISKTGPDGTRWRRRSQTGGVVLTRTLYMPIAIGTLLLGAIFGCLGAVLVYLGAKGETHIKMFGASLETADVGVAAIFLAVLMVILVIRRLLKSAEKVTPGNETMQ